MTDEHLDETQEINLQTVKERAVRGVVILTGRTFILSFISTFAIAILGGLLDKSEFGIFWVVSAVVNFLTYFSDIGLAAALIQKKEKVSEAELKTTFTIQQALVIVLLIILFAASPYIIRFYNLGLSAKFLLYALGISFLFSSLKTIPSTLLERRLEFGKLVVPQVLETLVYNVVVLILAWKGFGLTSFAIAILARGFVGLVAIYIIQPWIPGIAFSINAIKKLLTFGIPYQINTFIALLKDDGMTLILGGVLGVSGVGILGWAQKWAYAPLRFFMDHVNKVTFPAFSRMQKEAGHLNRAVTRSIFFISFLVFPSLVGLLVLSPILIKIIPRYIQWEAALIPLAFIGINTIMAAITTPLTNLLSAVGRIKTVSKLMVMWTVLTWLFVPFLANRFGVNGAALGYALVGASSVVAIYIAKRVVDFSIKDSFIKPLIASIVMGAVIFSISAFFAPSLFLVALLIATGVITYMVIIYLLVGSSILTDAQRSFRAILGK